MKGEKLKAEMQLEREIGETAEKLKQLILKLKDQHDREIYIQSLLEFVACLDAKDCPKRVLARLELAKLDLYFQLCKC